MTERETVVSKTGLMYEGICRMREVFALIQDFCKTHGYEFVEKKHTESVTPAGKHITLHIMLPKRLTDYAQSVIVIRAEASGVKDKVVERHKKRKTYQTGKIQFTFEGIMETDYAGRVQARPAFLIMRKLFETFAFNSYLNRARGEIKEDVAFLKGQLKAFLNLEKYS